MFAGRIEIRVYPCAGNGESDRLDRVLAAILDLTGKVASMSAELDTVIAKVSALETVEDSAIALLVELKAKLDAAIASGDLAALKDLADRIGADTAKLAQAVVDNTPAGGPT
jgi:predicted nucleotide-binding protein (sugar kinase/HSP70/actin superfamily)